MPLPKNNSATDPAAADPNDAPLDLSLLRQHDQGHSLMDRAQRRFQVQDEIDARQRAHMRQAATTTLPHEAQLAALDRQTQQLADAERTQTGHRRLRETFDAEELDLSLLAISAAADPFDQRLRLTQLRSRYAPFTLSPELAQRIDARIATVEPVVQRNEQAALQQSIAASRYAPTLADARRLYPGRKINTLFDPDSRTTFFVPGKLADPDLQAEAVQVIQNAFHLAKVTGKHAYLEAALDDEAVRQVSRIPGNQASAVFERALAALSAPAVTPAPAPAAAPMGDFYLGGDYSVRPRPANVPAEVQAGDDPLARAEPAASVAEQGDDPLLPAGSAEDPSQPRALAGRRLRYPPAIRARKPIPQGPYQVDPLANFPLEAKSKWDYSRNERIIAVPVGMTVEEALSAVRKDFEEFKNFSNGKNNIAKAVVDKDAKRAFFTLGPVRSALSAGLAQNDTTVGVGLKKVGDTQVAVTLANHQLRGMRTWEATDLGNGRISIKTEAYEIPRTEDGPLSTIGNAVGTQFMRGDQAAVWDNYFQNIDDKHFVGAGQTIPFQHAQYPEAIVNPFAEYFKDASPTSASSDQPQPPGSTVSPAQGNGGATGTIQHLHRSGGGVEAGATGGGSPLQHPALSREEKRGPAGGGDAGAPKPEKTDETSAFALGWEWVAGKGPRQRIFREGDKVTTQIQSSPEVMEGRQKMARRIARGDFRELSFGRNAGQEPVLTYPIRFAADLFNNPTRAFLGSYGAKAEVMEVNEDSAVVRYTITNRSGLESASRLPVFGYEKRSDGTARPTLTEMLSFQASTDIKEWSDLIPRSILPDNAYDLDGPGPGSSKEQAIIWFETLPIKTKQR